MSSPNHLVEVRTEVTVAEGLVSKLQTAVMAALQQEGVRPSTSLTLLLTGDERMAELNLSFRQAEGSTDVLSFPAGVPMPGMEESPPYLGDVVISVPYAGRQAKISGHDLEAELQLLAVHGVLHLLGHDHATPEEKGRMWRAQAAVLSRLGLSDVAPTEE